MNDLMHMKMIEYRDRELLKTAEKSAAPKAQKEQAAPAETAKAATVCMSVETPTDVFNTCWYRVEETASGNQCVTEWGTSSDDDSYFECTRIECFTYQKDSGATKQGDFWGELSDWFSSE